MVWLMVWLVSRSMIGWMLWLGDSILMVLFDPVIDELIGDLIDDSIDGFIEMILIT